jgi:hypothetical protein
LQPKEDLKASRNSRSLNSDFSAKELFGIRNKIKKLIVKNKRFTTTKEFNIKTSIPLN